MATVSGIIQFNGRVGELTFYTRNGKTIARKRMGVSGKKVKTDAAFERTRENNAEFKTANHFAKRFRNSLLFTLHNADISKNTFDSYLHQRLAGAFQKILQFDESNLRGQRTPALGLSHVEGEKVLKKFSFNPKIKQQNYFSGSWKRLNSNTFYLQNPKRGNKLGAKTALCAQALCIEWKEGSDKFWVHCGNRVLMDFNGSPIHIEFPTAAGGKLFYLMLYTPLTKVNGEYFKKSDTASILEWL